MQLLKIANRLQLHVTLLKIIASIHVKDSRDISIDIDLTLLLIFCKIISINRTRCIIARIYKTTV